MSTTTLYRVAVLVELAGRNYEDRLEQRRYVADHLASVVGDEGAEVTYHGASDVGASMASVIVRFRAVDDREAARVAAPIRNLTSLGGIVRWSEIENLSTGRGAKRRTITLEA